MQKVYKIYGASTASANAVANIQIARRGVITGILFALNVTSGASVCRTASEISFANAAQITTNDTVGPLASAEVASPIASSQHSFNLFVPLDVGVNAGDRLYLNQVIAGTVSASSANIYIYVKE